MHIFVFSTKNKHIRARKPASRSTKRNCLGAFGILFKGTFIHRTILPFFLVEHYRNIYRESFL